MSEDRIDTAVAQIVAGIESLRSAGEQVSDVDSLAVVQQCEYLTRRLEHVSLETLGRLERRGALASLGLGGKASGLAALLGCDRSVARRKVQAAEGVTERVGLDGQVLPPVLEATAKLWESGDISLGHVEVIAALIDSPEVRRVARQREGIERQLAEAATQYTPFELRNWGTRLIRALDQDGPEPTDDDDREPKQPNELHLSPLHTGGGRIRGVLNAFTYDALMTALGGIVTPPKKGDDDPRTLAERRGDGLGQLAMFALAHDDSMATTGGARPHLNVIMTLAESRGPGPRGHPGLRWPAAPRAPARTRVRLRGHPDRARIELRTPRHRPRSAQHPPPDPPRRRREGSGMCLPWLQYAAGLV